MKTTVAFSIHPRALKNFRAAVKAQGGADRTTAEVLFLKCLAATPAPGSKPSKTTSTHRP